jgi:crotonobetainyl-CoA:carnitine CoA-transferase CaiB-like acyl-CoA transferase
MVEAALNAAVEQVIEHDAGGALLTRSGNRSSLAAPQGVYRCAGEDRWVAIAVSTDEQWDSLRRVLDDPPWARADALASAGGRRAAHDAIDVELGKWTSGRESDDVAELLVGAGVPAETVIPGREVVHNAQLRHRGLFEVEDHPVTGRHEIPGLPFRFSRVDRWAPRPSPTLGEHNDEVLGEVASPEELGRLRAAGVIGERLAGS